MTRGFEVIDGNRYLVTRNGQGDIIVMAAAALDVPIVDPRKNEMKALLEKGADKWDAADLSAAVACLLAQSLK